MKTSFLILGFIGIVLSAGLVYISWVSALPNEWVLIIEDGRVIKMGVGLRCFTTFYQQAVKFPSTIQKMEFNSSQVTLEMQGVTISGFVSWSVFREGDGPFRFYKYMVGTDHYNTILTLTESILRHQIANHKLKDVITHRSLIRDKIRSEMSQQLNGWGVWLETVEITDVKINSRQMFEDLQAEYRYQTRLEAEQFRQDTLRKMSDTRLNSELESNKTKIETQNELQLMEQNKDLELQKNRLKIQQEINQTKSQQEISYYEDHYRKQVSVKNQQLQAELVIYQNQTQIETDKNAINQEQELLRKQNEYRNSLNDSKAKSEYELEIYQSKLNEELKKNQTLAEMEAQLNKVNQQLQTEQMIFDQEEQLKRQTVEYQNKLNESKTKSDFEYQIYQQKLIDDTRKTEQLQLAQAQMEKTKIQIQTESIIIDTQEQLKRLQAKYIYEFNQTKQRSDFNNEILQLELADQIKKNQSISQTQAEIAKINTILQTEQFVFNQQESLKRKQKEFESKVKEHEINLQLFEQEKDLQLKKMELTLELKRKQVELEILSKKAENDLEINFYERKVEAESKITDVSLRKQEIEALQSIYQKIPLQQVKIDYFVGSEDFSMTSLLPGISRLLNQQFEKK